MQRSVNTDITLDPGRYHVLVKVTAYRNCNAETPENVVRQVASERREKLVQIGLSYDLAHAKGLPMETEEEKRRREEREESQRLAERNKLREETLARMKKEYIRNKKLAARRERQGARHSRSISQVTVAYTETPIMYGTVSNGDNSSNPSNGCAPVSTNGLATSKGSNGAGKPARPSVDTHLATDGISKNERELLEGFEFDSDIDMPPDEPRDTAPSKRATEHNLPLNEDTSSDPWNAVCVVGLKVYSKDRNLSLQVRRSPAEEDTEAALDCDDPAASATTEKGTWFLD